MKHIFITKLGNYYEGVAQDKNGGQAEYNYILTAMHDVMQVCNATLAYNKTDLKRIELAIVVNGVFSSSYEKQKALMEIKHIRERSKKLLFVLTDFAFIEENAEFIKLADKVLHQSPLGSEYKLFGKPGEYSYVPELFFDVSIPRSNCKHELCFFGGNTVGREEELREFISEERNGKQKIKKNVVMFYKAESEQDFRVEYHNYRRILSLFKFAFISGRAAGKEVGWVTPRLVEALNANCIPILVNGYDSENHFGLKAFRATSNSEMQQMMDDFEDVSFKEIPELKEAKLNVAQGKAKFVALMKKEMENLHDSR